MVENNPREAKSSMVDSWMGEVKKAEAYGMVCTFQCCNTYNNYILV